MSVSDAVVNQAGVEIIDAVTTRPGMSKTDLSRQLHRGPNTVQAAVAQLEDAGLVRVRKCRQAGSGGQVHRVYPVRAPAPVPLSHRRRHPLKGRHLTDGEMAEVRHLIQTLVGEHQRSIVDLSRRCGYAKRTHLNAILSGRERASLRTLTALRVALDEARSGRADRWWRRLWAWLRRRAR